MVNASDLVAKFQYALSDKWGYIYGTSGQLWTAKSQAETTDKMALEYGRKWINHRVADCSGLFSWAMDQLGGYLPHGSNSIYRKYLIESGENMNGLEPGTAVFKRRPGTKYADGIDWYHIGLYIGNGQVIEAKGTPYGVVKSSVSSWHAWGRLKGVNYTTQAPTQSNLQPGAAVVDVPNNGTVNVRQSPSLSALKVDTIREGEPVTVADVSGEWAKVAYTKTGYVMAKYLKEAKTT